MNNDLISREAGNERERAKIKTNFAKIIVEGIAKEPYYSILYYDPKCKEYINGYGSYNINNVFNWLAEEFEINNDAPAVDAEPVRHGRWVCKMMPSLDDVYYFSVCGAKAIGYDGYDGRYYSEDSDYCPHCGAKMDGDT